MRTLPLLATALLLVLVAPRVARADCIGGPGGCYCQAVPAVVDGTVTEVIPDANNGDRLKVRVEGIPAGSAAEAGVMNGDILEMNGTGFFPDAPTKGSRVLVPLHDAQTFGWQQFVVDADGNTNCNDRLVTVDDAADLLTASSEQCNQTIRDRGWVTPCDDTSSCRVPAARPAEPSENDPSYVLTLLAGLALAWRARRR